MKKILLMMLCLCSLPLLASHSVTKNASKNLLEQVKKELSTNKGFRVIYNPDLASLKCQGAESVSDLGLVVGVCTIDGDRGEPNSDAVFGITVFQPDFEVSEVSYKIIPLTGEI